MRVTKGWALVADSPFDQAIPLDGMVGSLEDLRETPPNPKGVLQVFVSGEAVSGSRAMGVAKDLERLVHAFVQRQASTGTEKIRVPETPSSGEEAEIEIALHGLVLEPDVEDELRHLIRGRVREHLAGGEAGQ
jgi:hypothetical protein